jgi:hypothetical protein
MILVLLEITYFLYVTIFGLLVTVAERSETFTVFAPFEAGTVSSNPTQGMDV